MPLVLAGPRSSVSCARRGSLTDVISHSAIHLVVTRPRATQLDTTWLRAWPAGFGRLVLEKTQRFTFIDPIILACTRWWALRTRYVMMRMPTSGGPETLVLRGLQAKAC